MKHLGTKTLQTDRLILRRMTLDDAESICKHMTNENVLKYFIGCPYKTIDEARERVKKLVEDYQKDDCYYWGITLKGKDEVMGGIGSYHVIGGVNDAVANVEVGYWLAYELWGKGIMTAALKAVIKFYFEEVKVNVVRASTTPLNPGSRRVMEKANMVFEGALRKSVILPWNNNLITDDVYYSILKEEYFK